MQTNSLPGFTADRSLAVAGQRQKTDGQYTQPHEDDRVTPAQLDWPNLLLGGSHRGPYVVSDCPPGQRMTYVEGRTQTKYCDVPAPTRDPVTGRISWGVQHVPCGT